MHVLFSGHKETYLCLTLVAGKVGLTTLLPYMFSFNLNFLILIFRLQMLLKIQRSVTG